MYKSILLCKIYIKQIFYKKIKKTIDIAQNICYIINKERHTNKNFPIKKKGSESNGCNRITE